MEMQNNFKKYKSGVDGLRYYVRHVEMSWNCLPASKSVASKDWEWIPFGVCIQPVRPLNMLEVDNTVIFESDKESSQDMESDEDSMEIYSDHEDEQETDDEEEIEEESEEEYESESYSLRRAPKFCRRCSAVINCSCVFARKEFEPPLYTFIKQRQKIKNVCAFCSKEYPTLRDSTKKLPIITEKPDTNTLENPTEYIFLDRTKEWVLPATSGEGLPIFLFVVDMSNGSLVEKFEDILRRTLKVIPERAKVGVVSFDENQHSEKLAPKVFHHPSKAKKLPSLLHNNHVSSFTCILNALSYSTSDVKKRYPQSSCRMIAIMATPCSRGQETFSNESISSFESLSDTLVQNNHVLDVFACSNKVGVANMKSAVEKTGGLIVVTAHCSDRFMDSVKNLFEKKKKTTNFCSDVIFTIKCPEEIKIKEIIGLGKEVGKDTWRLCGIDERTCLTILFDIQSHHWQKNEWFTLQFLTRYKDIYGQRRLRVTTVIRRLVNSADSFQEILTGLDVQPAAVVIARTICMRMEQMNMQQFDVIQWLTRAQKFLDLKANDVSSVIVKQKVKMLLEYMIHMEESPFVKVNDPDNNDLRVYYNLWLKRETVKNCAIMIYPRFVGKFDNLILSSQATLIESLKEGCKSVFDDYFHIYIYYGETKNSKRKRNRHGKKTQEDIYLDTFLKQTSRKRFPLIVNHFSRYSEKIDADLRKLPLTTKESMRALYKRMRGENLKLKSVLQDFLPPSTL